MRARTLAATDEWITNKYSHAHTSCTRTHARINSPSACRRTLCHMNWSSDKTENDETTSRFYIHSPIHAASSDSAWAYSICICIHICFFFSFTSYVKLFQFSFDNSRTYRKQLYILYQTAVARLTLCASVYHSVLWVPRAINIYFFLFRKNEIHREIWKAKETSSFCWLSFL